MIQRRHVIDLLEFTNNFKGFSIIENSNPSPKPWAMGHFESLGTYVPKYEQERPERLSHIYANDGQNLYIVAYVVQSCEHFD
jgi:hypothetical protein